MNIRNILTGALALSTLAAAQADVEVRLTGATAFRTAAMNAIKAQFDLGGSYTFAHDFPAGGFNGSNRCTFKGTFPGVAGVTTVRCSWNGSVEGVRAVALGGAFNPNFITDAALASPGGDAGEAANENALVSGSTVAQVAKFSFSDVRQSSTPITSPVLSPANARVGVVVFSMITNEGAPANFTNVTQQQMEAIISQGFLPLSVFTGDPADNGKNVYWTGRNDGSGTRTSYMAESQIGITALANQYISISSAGNNINIIRRVPAGDGSNASTVWGQDVDGNGGYFSGSVLRGDMGRLSNNVEVLDFDNSTLEGPGADVLLLTFLTNPDANAARVSGGKILGYNGSTMASLNTGTTLSTADRDKVAEGQYSAWNFQQLYYSGSLSTDENTVYNAIKTGIPTTLVSAGRLPGIPLGEMNVSRPDDGAPIAP